MKSRQISAKLVTLLAISIMLGAVLAVGTTVLILRTTLSERFAIESGKRWVDIAVTTLMSRANTDSLALTETEERSLLGALAPGGIVDYYLLDPDGRVVRTTRRETLGAKMDADTVDRIRAVGFDVFMSDPIRNRPLQDRQVEAYAALRKGNTLIGFVGVRIDRVEAGQDIFRFAEIGFIGFALVVVLFGGPALVVLYRHLDARAALERDLERRSDDLIRAEKIANVGHWTLRRDTDMYEWSPELYRIFGVLPEEFVPTAAAVTARFHRADRQAFAEAGVEAIRTGKTVRLDMRITRPSKEVRYTENFIDCMFDDKGLGIGFFGVTRDITEQVEQESQLRAARDSLQHQTNELATMAQELQTAIDKSNRANAAKGDFLAMMSHELRTPMTGIIGIADLLRLSGLPSYQEGLVTNLSMSAHTLLNLLNDILDFSKIEAGKIELEHVDFSLNQLLMTAQRLFEPAVHEKGNVLTLHTAPDMIDTVVGDPKRLHQVLINLISNANKFTDNGAIAVFLRSKINAVGACEIELSIRDTGIGMSVADRQKLFQPFIQATSSTSRRYGGTGLGLSICKRLIDAMDGEIRVDSEVGIGSIFTVLVTLPVGDPTKTVDRTFSMSPLALPSKQGAKSFRILVAEDNPINRDLFQAMLTRLGHQVDVAENGELAVEAALRGDHDIILMDMQMPVMDGQQATSILRSKGGHWEKLPVIALTADAISTNHQQYLDAGVNAVVTKPVDWLALISMMEKLAHGTGQTDMSTQSDAAVSALNEPQTVSASNIDSSVIENLCNVLPRDIVIELMEKFVTQTAIYVDELREAAVRGDLKKTKQIAHGLKGSSLQFGALRLAEIAQYIEEVASNVAEVNAVLTELDVSAGEVDSIVSEIIKTYKQAMLKAAT